MPLVALVGWARWEVIGFYEEGMLSLVPRWVRWVGGAFRVRDWVDVAKALRAFVRGDAQATKWLRHSAMEIHWKQRGTFTLDVRFWN